MEKPGARADWGSTPDPPTRVSSVRAQECDRECQGNEKSRAVMPASHCSTAGADPCWAATPGPCTALSRGAVEPYAPVVVPPLHPAHQRVLKEGGEPGVRRSGAHVPLELHSAPRLTQGRTPRSVSAWRITAGRWRNCWAGWSTSKAIRRTQFQTDPLPVRRMLPRHLRGSLCPRAGPPPHRCHWRR